MFEKVALLAQTRWYEAIDLEGHSEIDGKCEISDNKIINKADRPYFDPVGTFSIKF